MPPFGVDNSMNLTSNPYYQLVKDNVLLVEQGESIRSKHDGAFGMIYDLPYCQHITTNGSLTYM